MRTLVGLLLIAIGVTANAQALKKLTLFGQPSVNNAAIWMAIEYGYFKEQGLDVDYRVFPSGTTAFQTFKKLTLFGQPSVNNDAIWMAIEYGYFKEQALDVDYRVFPSGTTAFQTFKTGQGDIVMTGDLPSVQYL